MEDPRLDSLRAKFAGLGDQKSEPMTTVEGIIAILQREHRAHSLQDNVYAARTAHVLKRILDEIEGK